MVPSLEGIAPFQIAFVVGDLERACARGKPGFPREASAP